MKTIIDEDLNYIFHSLGRDNINFKDSQILITGCAGFLGFYFMHYFAEYGDILGINKVIGLDNFTLGFPDWLGKEKFKKKEKFEIRDFDIARDKIESIQNYEQINFVIHAASIASPTFYRKYPLRTIEANVWGLKSLLEAYKNSTFLKGFLFFSSSEIYGDPSSFEIPTKEDYRGNVSCVGPRACYDESKRFGETLCFVYNETYKMPITIARPFNNFGPGMNINDKRLPADLANCIVENKDIVIFSDGTPTRTFCYISDAIIGYLKCLTFGSFNTFNIGIDGPEISVEDFCNLFILSGNKNFNYNGVIIKKQSTDLNYLTDNPNRRCPNIDKAREILDFQPSISVFSGVDKYLRFLKENL
jgi:UDP-glucuronate decarboxylase